jgi:hydroxymethylbilane synthase
MRIGTRGSALALAQARLVAERLGGAEIVVVRVSGDAQALDGQRREKGALHGGGPFPVEGAGDDKSRWVAELEQALLDGEIDLAVHSAKDVPGVLADGLKLLGAPPRAPAEDVLIGANSLAELPIGARVGTSSVRRTAQLLATREDLHVMSVRGNVDTRLRKLVERGAANATATATATGTGTGTGDRAGDPRRGGRLAADESPPEAIVLARAGLQRLGREHEIGATLDAERFVPAPGQGALALEGRSDDTSTIEAVAPILDGDTTACLTAERAVARALDASCSTPLGAHAVAAGCGCLNLRAWVGLPDGSQWVRDELLGGFYDPRELGERVAQRLLAVGAGDLLTRAREMAVERG